MAIDFRKYPTVIMVSSSKYLGTVFDDNLTFELHDDAVCGKAHRHIYSYPKLQSFNLI